MMEKLDAWAIRCYNWAIITILSAGVYIFLLIVSWIEPKEIAGKFYTYKQIRDAVAEFALGDKK